jgi:hypothetical protein
MPALTRKAKRRHFDSQEEEEGSENEAVVGILDRRAARRQAAQEAERELQRQQVRFTVSPVFLALLISEHSLLTTRTPLTRMINPCHVD